MIKKIIKTFIHLCDDKGWDKTEEIEGDWNCGRTYFIPKRTNLASCPLLSIEVHPLEEIQQKYYEFELIKKIFEPLDEQGKTVAKHLFFEMIIR